jgi:hypothetical protein
MASEDTTQTPAAEEREITVSVPADRVPEFYAFYARFLAGRPGRRRGRHGRGRPGHGPGRCRHHGERTGEPAVAEAREA